LELIKHIGLFGNAVNSDICRELISATETQTGWSKSLTGAGMDSNYRSNTQFSLTKEAGVNPSFKRFDDIIFRCLNEAIVQYQRVYGKHPLVTEDEGYSILRYENTQEYQLHTDSGPENKRLISALVYLNDDFEGGETDFPLQSYQVKPKAGMICLFPSIYTHPHASLPVVKGVKYVIVTWFKGFN